MPAAFGEGVEVPAKAGSAMPSAAAVMTPANVVEPVPGGPGSAPADRASVDLVTQPGEFALDPTVSPSRILLRHKQN
jgi:hypothetical protein